MKNSTGILVLFMILMSCNSGEKKNDAYSAVPKTEKAKDHPGKTLMETNCYICHSPTATQDARIGPPMIAIKKHYINDTITKEAFVAALQAWIKNPNAEDVKMFGAVKRFGVMPKQAFPEAIITQIAEYMYDFEIEQPIWFETHFKKQKGKSEKKF
ncbi:MAG: c-type cytochrome [Winogradskyella sp.]|uniref:c-type cytochrome n=1 Tax=Winogradskyella sp. TaxID=1883156 RepID=UPI00385FE456